MSKKKKGQINFTKYLAIFLVIVSLIVLFLIYFIGVLPIEYFLVLSALIVIIDLINIKLLLVKSKIQNALGIFFSLILIIFMTIGITYELNTIDFLKQFGFNSYNTENYNLVVLKDNNIKELNDIKNKKIGHLDTNEHEGLNEVTKKLKNKINYESVKLDDITSLLDNLLNEDVQAIILEDAQLNIIEEENSEIYKKLEIIYQIDIEVEIEKIGSSVDVTKDPFNILISGSFVIGFGLTVLMTEVDAIANVFGCTTIDWQHWLALTAISAIPLVLHEVVVLIKYFFNKNKKLKFFNWFVLSLVIILIVIIALIITALVISI